MNEEYDETNNLIHSKSSYGSECWKEYDENNNEIHSKNSAGHEQWSKWNNNKQIVITEQEFKQIKRTKAKQELYFNIKNSNRFEIMDI